MDKCNCYHEEYNKPECYGTKEREECSCSGDETKCNFYPEKRAAAQAKKVMEKFYENKKNEVIKNAIHCMKVGSGMAVCEDCALYECDHTDVENMARLAIKALERQIPQKPYYRKEEDSDGYACPVCNMGVTVDHGRIRDTFCSHCGQALDWTD